MIRTSHYTRVNEEEATNASCVSNAEYWWMLSLDRTDIWLRHPNYCPVKWCFPMMRSWVLSMYHASCAPPCQFQEAYARWSDKRSNHSYLPWSRHNAAFIESHAFGWTNYATWTGCVGCKAKTTFPQRTTLERILHNFQRLCSWLKSVYLSRTLIMKDIVQNYPISSTEALTYNKTHD